MRQFAGFIMSVTRFIIDRNPISEHAHHAQEALMDTLRIKLVSPVSAYLDDSVDGTLAPRPRSLMGKRIGLLPNWRPAAMGILGALGKLLQERYQIKNVVMEPPLRKHQNPSP